MVRWKPHQAKEQGPVSHVSISSHADPQVLLEAFNRLPFESALVALSALDQFMLSFASSSCRIPMPTASRYPP